MIHIQGDCGVLCHGDLCLCFDLKANHLNRTSFHRAGEVGVNCKNRFFSMRCLAWYLVFRFIGVSVSRRENMSICNFRQLYIVCIHIMVIFVHYNSKKHGFHPILVLSSHLGDIIQPQRFDSQKRNGNL